MQNFLAPINARSRLIAALFTLTVLVAVSCSSSTTEPVSAGDQTASDTDPTDTDAEHADTDSTDADADAEHADTDSTDADAEHADNETDHQAVDSEHAHHGDSLEVAFTPIPTIALEVLADPISGWNVHAVPTGHRLAPEHASTEAIDGEGHMHLYVDGERVSRLYGEWFHLRDLAEGDHDVRVELSANNHQALSVDGVVIDSAVTITQTATADDAMGDMSEDDAHEHDDDAMAMGDAGVVVTFAGETLEHGERKAVSVGDQVTLRVEADVADQVHVHGYDLLVDVTPEVPADISFQANLPGIWEIELEDQGLLLVELQVN